MNALNSILLEGFVVEDAKLETTPSGSAKCSFDIKSSRNYREQDSNKIEQEDSFFHIETWGKLAESCAAHCMASRGIRMIGRLKQYRFKNEETGEEVESVRVIAEHVEFKPILTRAVCAEEAVDDL